MRRTPMEVFINAQTDRQAAYEKRRRDQGLTRVAVWVPLEDVQAVKDWARERLEAHEAREALRGLSADPSASPDCPSTPVR